MAKNGADRRSLDLRVWTSPVEIGGKTYVIAAMRDISDEKRREVLQRTFFHDVLNEATLLICRLDAAAHGIMEIKASDISGDGYLDLLLIDTRNTYIGRYIQILINNRDGTFVDETSKRISQTYHDGWLVYLQLLDLNYDGHVDFVARQMTGPGPLFYLNDGRGVFSEWDHGLDLYTFDFLDIDRDGRRDILNSGGAFDGSPEWHAIMRHIGCRQMDP